jgi:hypothetical protein
MSAPDKHRKALESLKDAMVEDILSLSDKEVLAEAVEDGEDPAEIAARMRRLFDDALALYCSFCGRSEAELSHRPVAGPANVRICIECCDHAKAAMMQFDRVEGRDLISYAEFKARNPRDSGK